MHAGPVRGQRDHAVGPRPAQRHRRHRDRRAHRRLRRLQEDPPHARLRLRATIRARWSTPPAGRSRRRGARAHARPQPERGLRRALHDDHEAAGRFEYKVRAAASRLTQFAWRSHVKDPGFQERLRHAARPRGRLAEGDPERRSASAGGVRLTGAVRRHDPPRGVAMVVQGRRPRAVTHVRHGRTNRKGRFVVALPLPQGRLARAHVQPSASRSAATPRFPYEPGYSKRVPSASAGGLRNEVGSPSRKSV